MSGDFLKFCPGKFAGLFWEIFCSKTFMDKLKCPNFSQKLRDFQGNFILHQNPQFTISRTMVPFVTAHLVKFHCTHHPAIPESDLHFTFCSALNALSKEHQSDC